MLKNNCQKHVLVMGMMFFSFMLFLTGCAGTESVEQEPSSEKKISLAFPWSPASLDPHGNDSWEIMRSGTGETLVKLNEELETVPWLAKEWTQKNETTWVFQLEDNVHFHNGKVMDAASVKESLLRSIEKDQKVNDLLQVESMDVLSENELEIVTTQPNAALAAHLADPSTIVVDVATVEDPNQYPAFTGAFQIKTFHKDESLVVERYEEYWGEPALLSEVNIQFIPEGTARLMALQSGDVDGATDIPVDNMTVLEKNQRFNVFTAPSLRTHMMLFNMKSPLLTDINIRKGIDLSIPREEIVQSVMMEQGIEAVSPFPEILPFGKIEKKEETASIDQLLTNGGWQKNEEAMWEKQGKPLVLTMLTFPQRPELTVMAEIIQSELLNEGIDVTIRQMENIDEALANDKWDLSMYSMLTAHTGDPQYFLNMFYLSGSDSNVSRYASTALDQLVSQLNQTVDSDERNQLAIRIQNMINSDLPQSFIVHPKTVFGVKKGVEGFTPHPIEYYYVHSQMNVNE